MRRGLLEWMRGIAIWTASLGLYLCLGGESLRLIWFVCTLLLAGGALLRLLGPSRLTIRHSCSPSCIYAGDSAEMTVQIDYRSVLPLPWLIMTDRIGNREYRKLLFPGMRRRLEYTYHLNQVPRGVWSTIDSDMEWGDLFGWFTAKRRLLSDTNGFIVLPRPIKWTEANGLVHGSDMEREQERALVNVWNEMRGTGVRDYAPGDPMNRIHWKNSAKLGRLQSFMPHEGRGIRQGIVLDTAFRGYMGSDGMKPQEAFEEAVSAASGIVSQLLRYRVPFMLWLDKVDAEQHLIEYKGTATEHLQKILLPLASVQLTETRFRADGWLDQSRKFLGKNTEWAIVTGVFHQNAASAGIQLLHAGSSKVTIYCTQHVQPANAAVKVTDRYRNNPVYPEWGHEFFRKGGKLVYLKGKTEDENSIWMRGDSNEGSRQLAVHHANIT